MIAARLEKPDGAVCIMLVLEPGNLEKLKRGEPIHKWLNEFMPGLTTPVELLFAYTPDAVWVAEQMKGLTDGADLASVIEASLSRPEVLQRGKSAEDMKRTM